MKVRQGFVSNSSSTCFLISVPKEGETCEHCGKNDRYYVEILDYLLKCFHSEGGKVLQWYNKEQTMYIAEVIVEGKKDIKWSKAKIDELERLRKNYLLNHAISKMEELFKLLSRMNMSGKVETRWLREWEENGWHKDEKNVFMRLLDHLKEKIKQAEKDVNEGMKKLRAINEYRKKGRRVCYVEIDNFAGTTGRLLEDLLNSGHIDIIERTQT